MKVRADLQLPAFVNQTNVVNCGCGTNAKSPTVSHTFFMPVSSVVFSTISILSYSLAFPLECTHSNFF